MDIYSKNKDEIRWKLLKFKVLEEQIVKLFKVFRQNEIEPILLKGWAAGLYYPNHFERVFSDIDLAVSPDQFEKAVNLSKELNLTVDLHNGFKKHDTLNWERIFENTLIKEINGYSLRILCPEDHLRILCVHWLIDGGIYKEKLWDIFYLIEKCGSDFDWDKCLNVVEPKRQKWIIITIGLVQRYLGLNTETLPFQERLGDIPDWVIRTVTKEWKESIPLRPLQTCLGDRKILLQQIKKRIPPNMIQATIEMDGEFDNSSRFKFQLMSVFNRVQPSLKRILKTILTGEKY